MKQPELGNKISQLRKAKGLTQEELVERCNVSVRTIQRIETGEVNPRSYTVRTILSALESNFDELHSDTSFSKKILKTLTVSWMAGIVYFTMGLLEGPMDINRMITSSEIPEEVVSDFIPMLSFSPSFYVLVKILVLAAYVLFLRGFLSIGTYTGNPLLSVVPKILIGLIGFVITFDILTLFYPDFDGIFVQMAMAFAMGALSILFGIALFKLSTGLGVFCIFAGVIEILSGVLFLFLQPIGLIIQMVAVLFEIMIVYQASRAIAEGANIGTSN